jgi:methionyl-tRNA synthetase
VTEVKQTEMAESFYITTPLYYVNASPHLGGTYTTIVCDTIARYKRMMGFDVKLLTGTDEHGQKIERSARDQGIEPQALADNVVREYKDLWESIGVRHDLSIRTTEPRHYKAVQEIYRRVKANGFIYKDEYTGWYCVSCEAYAADTNPDKPAPCPDCGRETEWFAEESYFFKLSAFQDRLLEYYDEHPDFVRPSSRRNEVLSFVKGGLRDLSISRTSLKWGVPFPDDPEHVFYVWFDALTGYMSGVGFESDNELFERYWPADIHVVGKDILRFHAVYWPAFLLAAELPVPKTVYGHGWWMFNDEKMSKSRGNVMAPGILRDVFGIELLRYFLLREMVFGQDSNLNFDSIIQRSNSDLANDLGNLLSRTIAMLTKYRDGVVPESGEATGDADVREVAERVIADYIKHFDNYEFSRGLENVWSLISRVNKYIVENEPWAIAKDESKANRLNSVLFHCVEALRLTAVLLSPVMPETSESIWSQLGLDGQVSDMRLDQLQWSDVAARRKVAGGSSLFPRVDPKAVYAKLEAASEAVAEDSDSEGGLEYPPLAPMITIEDFAKIDLRVATVVEAEKVKGADKLLRLVLDLGFETRQVLAGIAQFYEPEALVGRKVSVVANLKPRKMRGLESNGMIMAASLGSDDAPVLVGFQEDIANGARLR